MIRKKIAKGVVPPVKCATGLRYIPDRANPYSLNDFVASGILRIGTKKEQTAWICGGGNRKSHQSPTECSKYVPALLIDSLLHPDHLPFRRNVNT